MVVFLIPVCDLQDDESDDGACELGEESEGDGGVEIILGLSDDTLIFVFEAGSGGGYIFSW